MARFRDWAGLNRLSWAGSLLLLLPSLLAHPKAEHPLARLLLLPILFSVFFVVPLLRAWSERRPVIIAFWLAVLAMVAAAPASAQPASGFQGLAAAILQGDSVIVRDRLGNSVRGTVDNVSSSTLRVRVDGIVREWAAPDVAEVRRRGDSLVNGALWGLLAGGGTAAVSGGLMFTLCANEGGQNCPQLKKLSIAVPLAAGVGIGLLVDALRSGETVVFKQPTLIVVPTVAPGRAYAVNAAWRF